jgi:hypothetical protein
LVGWLSGFWAQTGSVAKATFVRRLCEAAAPGEGRGVRAVPRLCILYPGICLTTEENHGKPVRVAEKRSNDQRQPRFVSCTWQSRAMVSTGSCRSWLTLQATGSTLGQRKYLPSCRTRGFLTSDNFESKLAIRALMWSANSGTPRSSSICLLRTMRQQLQDEDNWIATPVASGYGSGQRTSTRGTHNPS